MKRFTETTKWQDPWFRKLPAKMKAFWLYLVDNCDLAGIWNPDMELAGFQIGEEFTMEEIHAYFGDRITILENGRWFVPKFIEFQYGELNPANRCHASVIKALALNKCEIRIGEFEMTGAPVRAEVGSGVTKRKPGAGGANGAPAACGQEAGNAATVRETGEGAAAAGEGNGGLAHKDVPDAATTTSPSPSSVEFSVLRADPSTCTPLEEALGKALPRASQGPKDKSKEQEQDKEEGEPGEETNDEFLDRLKREFAGCDVDGEVRRLKQIAEKEGTALSRNRVLAWMKKASPRVKAASPARPRFDTPKTADPPGWLDWVKATYGDDCQAYRTRQRFCDSPRDVREQFLRGRIAA